MATPTAGLVFFAPDRLERSVWVVIDPRDAVTGERLRAPVDAELVDVTAEPIAGLSGVYCFTDLSLPAGPYTAQVRPRAAARAWYFEGQTGFALNVVPVPGQPLNRNVVTVSLLPRPAYPFAAGTTLARGRLVRASDASALAGARIDLILDTVDEGLRGRTDDRGEFVVAFPQVRPPDDPTAVPGDLEFELRFVVDGQPPFVIPEAIVREGTAISLGEIQFPGI
jgi:hypothetical protein